MAAPSAELVTSVRTKIGLPNLDTSSSWALVSSIKGMLTTAYAAEADPAALSKQIFDKMATLPPNEIMVALQQPEIQKNLPEGIKTMLSRMGDGSPQFQAALKSALGNEKFRAAILAPGNGTGLTFGPKDLAQLKAMGFDDAAITKMIEATSTDMLTRIGKGEFDADFTKAGGAFKTTLITAAVNETLNEMAKDPKMREAITAMQGDTKFMQTLISTIEKRPELAAQLTAELKADGADANSMLSKLKNAGHRNVLGSLLEVMRDNPEIQFAEVKDILDKAAENDIQPMIDFLKKHNGGKELPSALANAETAGKFLIDVQKFIADYPALQKLFGAIAKWLNMEDSPIFQALADPKGHPLDQRSAVQAAARVFDGTTTDRMMAGVEHKLGLGTT